MADREAEGFDNSNTYGALAAEGFLSGYGLDIGAAVGSTRHRVMGSTSARELALALREYLPGNVIYANGHPFYPRFFHLEAMVPTIFQVDVSNEAMFEVGTRPAADVGLGAIALVAVRCALRLQRTGSTVRGARNSIKDRRAIS